MDNIGVLSRPEVLAGQRRVDQLVGQDLLSTPSDIFALDAAKLPNKFLDYPTGGHGYGLHCTRDARAWPQDALVWLEANHFAD